MLRGLLLCCLVLWHVDVATSRLYKRRSVKDLSGELTNLIAADTHIDISYFHKTDAIISELEALTAKCSWMSLERIRDATDSNFELPVVTIHKGPEQAATPTKDVKKILLNFGCHGRELISSEIALRLAQTLCSETDTQFGLKMAPLLEKISWKIVPVQNMAARRQAEVQKGTCTSRRKNARNVDLNRNWNISWANGESETASETYHGPAPFSEPETRIVAGLGSQMTPDVFVDVHAGDFYLGMPFCSKSEWPAPDKKEPMIAMLSHLRSQVFNGSIQFGPCSTQGEEPYISTGTAVDYMHQVAKAKYAFVFETWLASKWGGASALHHSLLQVEESVANTSTINMVQEGPMEPIAGILPPRTDSDIDCFAYFNPDKAEKYEWSVRTWTNALMYIGHYLLNEKPKAEAEMHFDHQQETSHQSHQSQTD